MSNCTTETVPEAETTCLLATPFEVAVIFPDTFKLVEVALVIVPFVTLTVETWKFGAYKFVMVAEVIVEFVTISELIVAVPVAVRLPVASDVVVAFPVVALPETESEFVKNCPEAVRRAWVPT